MNDFLFLYSCFRKKRPGIFFMQTFLSGTALWTYILSSQETKKKLSRISILVEAKQFNSDIISRATSALYPIPRTPSSLAWDKQRCHCGGAAQPLYYERIPAPPSLTGFGLWSFSIGFGPRLDGRALCQQLWVVIHHFRQCCFWHPFLTPPPAVTSHRKFLKIFS